MSWPEWVERERVQWRHAYCFSGYVWPDPERKVEAKGKKQQPRMRGDELIEEIEWLLEGGVTGWHIPAAVNRSPVAIDRLLIRYQRSDLANRLRASGLFGRTAA